LLQGRPRNLVCVLAGVVADAEPVTAIVGPRGEFGSARVIVVGECGEDGAQCSVIGG
jgi:hypothetical protein